MAVVNTPFGGGVKGWGGGGGGGVGEGGGGVGEGGRAQELCEGRGGRPGLPVPNSPYGVCGSKATLNMKNSLVIKLPRSDFDG